MFRPTTIATFAACSLFSVLGACSGADAQGNKPPATSKASAPLAAPEPSSKGLYYRKPSKDDAAISPETYKSKLALWEQTAPRTQGKLPLEEYCQQGYENAEWQQKCSQKK